MSSFPNLRRALPLTIGQIQSLSSLIEREFAATRLPRQHGSRWIAAPKFTRRGGGDVSFSAEAVLIFSIEQETARSTFASALEVERLLAKAFGR